MRRIGRPSWHIRNWRGEMRTAQPLPDWSQLAQDINLDLPSHIRKVMLDLVLAWVELDGAISMMASAIFGLNPTTGSILVGKMRVSEKLERVVRLHKAYGVSDSAKTVKRIKADYERLARARNLVARSKCAGVLRSDPNSVMFVTFEAPKHGELALDRLTHDDMRTGITWAKRLTARCLQIVDKSPFFVDPESSGVTPTPPPSAAPG